MAIKAFRGMSPGAQLLFAIFVVVVSFLVFLVFGILTAIPFFGVSEMLNSMSSGEYNTPDAIALLKYFQVMQSIGLFVVPPFVIAYLYEGKVAEYLQLNKGFNTKSFILATLTVFVLMPFIGFVGEWNSNLELPAFMSGTEDWMRRMETNAEVLIERFIQVESLGGLLFNIFMIAVIPALGEEFLFRGVVQKIFTNMIKNAHWGIWISAIIFSAFHMQFLGFVPRMLLGALFGYMLVWSKTIWLPVLCHFVNNLFGVLALHAQNQGGEKLSQMGEYAENMSVHWGVAFFSLMLGLLLLIALKKESEPKFS